MLNIRYARLPGGVAARVVKNMEIVAEELVYGRLKFAKKPRARSGTL